MKIVLSLLLPFLTYTAGLQAEFTEDAVILALREQYVHQSGIWLDSTMTAEIDSGLAVAREVDDTLQFIHAFSDYVLDELIVMTNAQWNTAWKQGQVLTGEPYIDSLSLEYGLMEIDENYSLNIFLLIFATPLEMRQLSELYEVHPEVTFAEPNQYFGDGDNIEFFKKNNILHFAFSHGWGDCPAGCIHRYYWYVSVSQTNTGYVPELQEEKYRVSGSTEPYIYRWNIPPRYAMTMFENADSIFNTILSAPDWWVRRHAIEGTWRLFVKDGPWVGEEDYIHWLELKNELESRRDEVISVLQSAVSDPDPDVSTSAENALLEISAIEIKHEIVPGVFALHQNYPNPFNTTTTIEFELSKGSDVELVIYNILGQKVATLVSGRVVSGKHKVVWDVNDVQSGVYFYRLTVGQDGILSHEKTKKMVVLK